MHALIMAGGSGTRFWPRSRHSNPKQLLPILGDISLLQQTIDRLSRLSFIETIFIATRQDLYDQIVASVDGVSSDHIIVEPSKKDTAACIGFSMFVIESLCGDSPVGIFPADHFISGDRQFHQTLRTAYDVANSGFITTLALEPTYPSDQYGYIEYDEDSFDGSSYQGRGFKEKPERQLAERFLASGNFSWNSGMFFWRPSVFFESFEKTLPSLYITLSSIRDRFLADEPYLDIWSDIEPVSIDVGMMNYIGNQIRVVPATFTWSDVGSWNTLYQLHEKDEHENVCLGDCLVFDGSHNFIESPDHFTAVVGLDGVIVSHTKDATLVTTHENIGRIKSLLSYLKEKNRDDIL